MNDLNLNQQLEQKQILTPTLILQMKLLALNSIELTSYLKSKSDENPFIEIETSFKTYDFKKKKKVSSTIDTPQEIIEKTIPQTISVFEYFDEQLSMMEVTSELKEYALLLVPYLNSIGILKQSLDDISKELGIAKEVLIKGQQLLSSIENKGIGSERLKELITYQIAYSDYKNKDEIIQFIDKYYDDLLNKRYTLLQKNGFSPSKLDDITKVLDILISIPSLNTVETAQYIYPDFIVSIEGDHLICSEVEYISIQFYYNLNKSKNQYQITDEIKSKINEAKFIHTLVNERKVMLKNFIEYLMLYQKDFFIKDKQYLKPITQKEFADKIGVSVSTLSRLVNNKYIQTQWGIFPLKHFFSANFNKKAKEKLTFSRQSIFEEIRLIIENEDKKAPYSDKMLVDIFKKKGYTLSRRTVTKYRDLLHILPAQKRKIIY